MIGAFLLRMLLSTVVPLAIKFGVDWVLLKFPNLPAEIRAILERLRTEKAYASADQSPKPVRKAMKQAAKRQAKRDVKRYCEGVGCPTDLK